MVTVERRDTVRILRLDRGITNAINPPLVGTLSNELRVAEEDPETRALVLTSAHDKFFSIGLDIPELFDLGREQFTAFLRAFDLLCLKLFTLPKPTLAAIGGHAIAGGFILAICCDYRYIAEGRKLMGLNETKLGVSIPYVAECVLRHLVGLRTAREVVDTGEFYESAALARMGIVDRILPVPDVVEAAGQKAIELGGMPGQAYAAVKRDRVEAIEAEILRSLEAKENTFVDLWYSQAARKQLKEAMEKFKPPAARSTVA